MLGETGDSRFKRGAPGRKAGDGHLKRNRQPPSLVDILERTGTNVWTIATNGDSADLQQLQPSIAQWSVPSLTLIHGTVLEAAPFHSKDYPSTTIDAYQGRFDALSISGTR